MSLARMRFPAQALAELRKEDPDTPVTLNLIRSLVKRGLVPSVQVGKRRLVNYDALIEYLAAPHSEQSKTTCGIRRIPE